MTMNITLEQAQEDFIEKVSDDYDKKSILMAFIREDRDYLEAKFDKLLKDFDDYLLELPKDGYRIVPDDCCQ